VGGCVNVLVTSGASEISQLIVGGLGDTHAVRLTDLDAGDGIVVCELGHDEATDRLCEGIDAIVLVCEPPDMLESDQIDYYSRRVYNLLNAATEQGISQAVLVSSLELFGTLDPSFEIDEQWAPAVTPDIGILRLHIAEFVCREFARSRQLDVTCLRFGKVVDGAPAEDETTGTAVIDTVRVALADPSGGWSVFHVVSSGTRFLTDRIEKRLDVQPRVTS